MAITGRTATVAENASAQTITGTIPGTWHNAFHTYAVQRKASSADVYWDELLVKSYITGDNGVGQSLLLSVDESNSRTPALGAAGGGQGRLRAGLVEGLSPGNHEPHRHGRPALGRPFGVRLLLPARGGTTRNW